MPDFNDIGPLPNLPKRRGRPRKNRTVSEEERARLTSDEHREHLKKIGFQKGREKTGGTVPVAKETKEWLAGKSMDVAQLLYEMAFDEDIHPKERMKAAMWIAEMSISKAATKVDVSHTVDIGEMLTKLNQERMNADKPAAIEAPIIDVTPNIIEPEADAVPLNTKGKRADRG